MRLDGELELPDGSGVSWRELARAAEIGGGEVLVKSMDGVTMRLSTDLFVPGSVS
jgi:hypothetical protein